MKENPEQKRKLEILFSFQCNLNCIFCSFGHKDQFRNKPLTEVKQELEEGYEDGIRSVSFTGGEPTIKKEALLKAVKYADQLGYGEIGIETNGMMLSYRSFCKKLKNAGINTWIISVHGHNSELHDKQTRTKGSFEKAKKGIKNLKELGEEIIVNCVVNKLNYKFLGEIANKMSSLGVDFLHLLFVNPHGYVKYNKDLVPRMSETKKYLKEAIKVGENQGMLVFVFYIPKCILPEYANKVIYYERLELKGPDTEANLADNREKQRIKFEKCKDCRFNSDCYGVNKRYVEIYGKEEFEPIS